MKTVFLLEHIYEDSSWNEHYKLIGIYSDQKEAQQAIERLKIQPGFKHYPDHFVISEMPLDTDAWQEGFSTAYWLELYSFIVIFANQSSLISQHHAKNLHHAIHDWITFLITEHKDFHSQIHHIETVNENLFTELHPQHHIVKKFNNSYIMRTTAQYHSHAICYAAISSKPIPSQSD